MTLVRALFLLTVFSLLGAGARGLKNVTISKCCNFDASIAKETRACAPVDERRWNLNVYSPRRQSFEKHKIPENWRLKEDVRPNCDKPKLFSAINIGSYLFFENGSIFIPEYDKLLHPSNYCLDYSNVLVCLEEAQQMTLSRPRVKKCCGNGAVYSVVKKSCVTMNVTDYKIDIGSDKILIFNFPICSDEMVIAGKLQESSLSLQPDGSLLLKETKTVLPAESFCLEHVLEHAGSSPSVITCHEHLPPTVASEPANNETDLRFTLYPIGLALSAVFLAATLAAGSLLPASYHVLHWRCQTNHVACLLVGDILLCITQLFGKTLPPVPCFSFAVIMHFLFLAAFFWLNTMCFNIWWTFRDLRPQSIEKSQERIRLRLYEIYAWGGSLLIAGTAAILDTVPDTSEYAFLRPKFGTNNCWFRGDLEILTYFFGPIGALLLINLALFAATARELTCGLWKRELVKSTTERAALGRVCMKLVVVMGITWIADILSWAVGGPQELWYVTDLINCLQGVFIFIVVGCQPQVLTAVKRLWCMRKHRTTGTAGTTNHHSSISQGMPSMGYTITNNSVANATKSEPLETSC